MMFNNVGGKIKSTAKFIYRVGSIGAVVGTIIYYVNDEDILTSLTIAVGGILGFWLGNIGLYAFGEPVENVAAIRVATEASLKIVPEAQKTSEANG